MQGQADTPTPTPTPTSSPTTTLPQVREGLRTLEFSRSMLLAMAEATPDEHLYQRPAEGASHAAWILGHLAATDDSVRASLGGGELVLESDWHDQFKAGTTCRDGSAGYPDRAALLDALARSRTALMAWFGGLTESELAEPLSGGIARIASDRTALMGSLAAHEAFHAGQISTARRVFGLPTVF